MKVGSKVGSNFGSVTVLVINYMDQRMELITSKLWVNRSNRFRGTIHSTERTSLYCGVCLFLEQRMLEIYIRQETI